MKQQSRADRRCHVARLKQTRRFYHGRDNHLDPRYLGKLLHTTKVCSCWMCGNCRHHHGRTRSEALHLAALAEEKLLLTPC